VLPFFRIEVILLKLYLYLIVDMFLIFSSQLSDPIKQLRYYFKKKEHLIFLLENEMDLDQRSYSGLRLRNLHFILFFQPD
jgi:hypothetical protein